MMEKTIVCWRWPGSNCPVRTVLSPLSCYNYWDFDRSAPATTCSTSSLLIPAWRTENKQGTSQAQLASWKVLLVLLTVGLVGDWGGYLSQLVTQIPASTKPSLRLILLSSTNNKHSQQSENIFWLHKSWIRAFRRCLWSHLPWHLMLG